eukprot:5452573-Karenia_brevis.AAC.1
MAARHTMSTTWHCCEACSVLGDAPALATAHFARQDFVCSQCNGVMDRYADHTLVCCCGGDRTKRHNLIRNSLHMSFQAAGFAFELEKPNLLRPRP